MIIIEGLNILTGKTESKHTSSDKCAGILARQMRAQGLSGVHIL